MTEAASLPTACLKQFCMIRGVILRAMSSFLVGAAAFMSVAAQTDDSQTELRLNPEIELNMPVGVDVSKYPFLHLDDNRIEMNGADWSRLADIFTGAKSGDNLFSVIYLGDSHIQADFGGDMLRERLMSQSRPAGRSQGLACNPWRVIIRSAYRASAGSLSSIYYIMETDRRCRK